MKIFSITLVVLLCLFALSPAIAYWWGLSNIENHLTPSTLKITEEKEKEIWAIAKETGSPKVIAMSPYSYITYFICEINSGISNSECAAQYPGIRVAIFSVRNQVRKNLGSHPSNLKWNITWVAYSIWVTRNWSTREITSTYYENYNT